MDLKSAVDLKTFQSEVRQRVRNAEAWAVQGKIIEDWLAQSGETGIWDALGSYSGPSLDNAGGFGTPLGSIDLTLNLLGNLKACTDYLGAGLVIARANGGVLDPDKAVDLIQWMPWCKANNRRSLRKNIVHRLKGSGLFEEMEGGDFVLMTSASRYHPVDEGLEPLSAGDDVEVGDDLTEMEVVAVNGAGSLPSTEG